MPAAWLQTGDLGLVSWRDGRGLPCGRATLVWLAGAMVAGWLQTGDVGLVGWRDGRGLPAVGRSRLVSWRDDPVRARARTGRWTSGVRGSRSLPAGSRPG